VQLSLMLLRGFRDSFDRIEFLFDYIDVRTVVYTILTFVTIVSLIICGWTYVLKRSAMENATMYFNNIIELDDTVGTNEYEHKLLNFYKKTKSPLYRVLLGSRLVDHFVEQKKLDDAVSVLNKLVKIKGVPNYVSDAIKIRLSSILLLMRKDDYQKRVTNLLLVTSKKMRPFWQLSREVYLELMYANSDMNMYKNGIEELSRNSDLPSNMLRRLEELVHIAAHGL